MKQVFRFTLIIVTIGLFTSCQMKRSDLVDQGQGIELDTSSFDESIAVKEHVEEVIIPVKPFYENTEYYNELPITDHNEEFVVYEVQSNETLMHVAFNLYSSIGKWRKIRKDNIKLLGKSVQLTPGMKLKIRKPLNIFQYPKGHPYLIRDGDTLTKISNKVYGVRQFWRQIYLNNTQLIKDPDLIFAGFTIFYPPMDRPKKKYLTSTTHHN